MLKALKELALYMPRQIKMAINFDKEIDRVGLQAKALNEHIIKNSVERNKNKEENKLHKAEIIDFNKYQK